jgi:hypothetical protein
VPEAQQAERPGVDILGLGIGSEVVGDAKDLCEDDSFYEVSSVVVVSEGGVTPEEGRVKTS